MKIRLTNKIFYDVIILMIGFGIFIGIVFPFFIVLMGIPYNLILNFKFFSYCIIAGIIVALMNITIIKLIIIHRIQLLSKQMNEVENTLDLSCIINGYKCNPDTFLLKEDSDDTLGNCISTFNRLIVSLTNALKLQSDIHSFSSMLSKHKDINILSDEALYLLMEYLSADSGVLLYEKNEQLMVASVSRVNIKEEIFKNCCIRKVMKEGKPNIITEHEDICMKGMEFEDITKNIIMQPIIFEERPIGVIILSRSFQFKAEDLNKLDLFSINLAMALENAIANERLQELATKDPLTGLFNRRFGMECLHEEYNNSILEAHPLGLIMLDIDNFKTVNDYYGHVAGDKALIHISNIIKNTFLKTDVLIRYGGEEILCILPDADLNKCLKFAENARKEIEDGTLVFENQIIKMTISGGISVYVDDNVKTVENLICEADKALYEAKRSGRNCIKTYNQINSLESTNNLH